MFPRIIFIIVSLLLFLVISSWILSNLESAKYLMWPVCKFSFVKMEPPSTSPSPPCPLPRGSSLELEKKQFQSLHFLSILIDFFDRWSLKNNFSLPIFLITFDRLFCFKESLLTPFRPVFAYTRMKVCVVLGMRIPVKFFVTKLWIHNSQRNLHFRNGRRARTKSIGLTDRK